MSQIFNPSANNIARLSILIGGLVALFIAAIFPAWDRSPYTDRAPAGIAIEQPVRFSHKLHSGNLNISCVYCHGGAEVSRYAGISDTHTCMSCHSQIALYSELLEPVRASYETGEPLVWNKVHDLAEHVYFNHAVHVNNGVGCESCHGRVDEMPLVWQAESMTMNWCMDCHNNPEEYLRPESEIYTFGWEPEGDQIELGLQLIDEYQINTEGLNQCSVCHY